jgi:hypothetical protein
MVSVNVFIHIMASAVRIVTPEMPRYAVSKICYWKEICPAINGVYRKVTDRKF